MMLKLKTGIIENPLIRRPFRCGYVTSIFSEDNHKRSELYRRFEERYFPYPSIELQEAMWRFIALESEAAIPVELGLVACAEDTKYIPEDGVSEKGVWGRVTGEYLSKNGNDWYYCSKLREEFLRIAYGSSYFRRDFDIISKSSKTVFELDRKYQPYPTELLVFYIFPIETKLTETTTNLFNNPFRNGGVAMAFTLIKNRDNGGEWRCVFLRQYSEDSELHPQFVSSSGTIEFTKKEDNEIIKMQ